MNEGTAVTGKYAGQEFTGVITWAHNNKYMIRFDTPIQPQASPVKHEVTVEVDGNGQFINSVVKGFANATYTKRMTADVWFKFQMRDDIEVIFIESERRDGEKVMVVTFILKEQTS